MVWAGQVALAAVLVLFVGRSLYLNWEELSALDLSLRIRPLWLLSALVTVWITYALLIDAWRRILVGWRQQLGYGTAMRIWCLSNIGRYLPGKVWSVAALAVMASRAGVAGWSAAASALVMQVLAVGTGALVVSVGAPGVATPVALACAGLIAAAVVFSLVWEPLGKRIVGIVRPGTEYHSIPFRTMLVSSAVTLMSWIAYGMAFLMLARGIFPGVQLSLLQSTGVFAAGYIVGLLALFAPGGVGIRELVFVALLAPLVGSGSAVALSIASRLLLTVTEVVAAFVALFVDRRKELSVGSPS